MNPAPADPDKEGKVSIPGLKTIALASLPTAWLVSCAGPVPAPFPDGLKNPKDGAFDVSRAGASGQY